MDKKFLKAIQKAPNPSYVLDEQRLIDNLTLLEDLQKQSGAKVLCALKGFAMWSTFPLLGKFLSGATASSLNEAILCDEEFKRKAHSCFVAYREEEFEQVLSLSSHVTFNSLNQYHKFKHYISSHPEVKFALRINPKHSAVTTDKYNPCMPGGRFGIPIDEFPSELPEGISGIHFHALCESNVDELEEVIKVLNQKSENILHSCQWVNMGGGHHITRNDYDCSGLIHLLKLFKQRYQVQIFLEPGEAIGWKTGVLLAKVEDLVKNDGINTAILNVSFSAHMPDCLEMPYQPLVYGQVKKGVHHTLGGNTCMSGDFISGFHFEKELKEGDSIIFEDMMHYTFVKSSTFNGVPLPAISVFKSSGALIIQREFSYQDFKNRLS